ncbi:DUF3800 domain-containing protein [Streptomyces griseomycini]|uniref:DUF3800 domain-containing protein n=1 Tax=Streptomyces griseomycini TaxID=66895 RepID=A0A7W7PU69_9ACTN|nr:DUF3800 domain-containing protein [Streptomyces griseomycini]MBB4901367.1 hypothetical protein [Streptomyces griseomycini]GGQ14184.1 hypothetical protein GCM10010266_41740 [Streptomyces griseomycini]GGR24245.1 hypothetical protein GCM10015536_32400 [Streptomyces griseomycini]
MSGNPDDGARAAGAGPPLEIACDESGSDGENLTGGNTDVFAHAGVHLSMAAGAAAVREVRDRIRSPAEEYKANHLLREKHRAVLEWLLAPGGPLHGRARVHLTEKAFFVVDRVVVLLLDDPAEAVALFRAGHRDLGPDGWRDFLLAANRLLRMRNGAEPGSSVPFFFDTVDALRRDRAGTPAARILQRLAARRERAEAYRAGLLDGTAVRIPVLNPLLPAIISTAAYWSAGGRPVRLVHDRQNVLTPERIAWIERTARRDGIALEEVRLVAARADPRVQLADFLAGIARKVASDELNGRGDPVLTALLRAYVDPASVWGDARSRAALGAGAGSDPAAGVAGAAPPPGTGSRPR